MSDTINHKKYMNTPTHFRIAIFTDDFFPKSGGVARSIELQIAELVRAGHEVTLFAPRPFFIAPDNCAYEALESWYIPGTESFLCSLKFGRRQAEHIVDNYTFDIIHSQNERGALFLASRVAQLMGVPHVHTFHSNYAATHRTSPFMAALNSLTYLHIAPLIMHKLRPARASTRIFYPRKLTAVENSPLARSDWKNVARLARYVDAFTSPAQYVIDAIVDASRESLAERAFTVPNGISPIFAEAERIRPQEEMVRFLSCSRLDPEKRVDVIIKAFAKLNNRNSELYILGSGSQEKRLKKLAAKLVKRGTVLFLGHYNDIERIANEYANSDVFVFASYRFDTQGMVLAEAAAAGTPILYCDDRLRIGVSPDNALLTHPSVSGIVNGMRELVHHPERRMAMSHASKQLGRRLTAEAMEQKFLHVYHSVSKPSPLIQ